MAAAGKEVKLIGSRPSPYVARVRIALHLKGVEYEFLHEEVFGNKSELLLRSNPVYKKIPVLIHGGQPICESLVIVQYIDEVWAASGPAILPADPLDRAVARFWAAYIDDKLGPNCVALALRLGDEASRAESKEQLFAGLQLLDEALGKISNGKSFFGGDAVGFLDIAFGSYLGWLKALEKVEGIKLLDESRFPRLAKWAERFCSAKAATDVIPEPDELVEFVKLLAHR
ncbi:hypothetical protein HPP92_015073 [Vanilla planifolia]|uniref:Glutathione S-transferase n=1 Tax=Vanilla planifolia TaxID=51239 RepID=A0A835UVG3_VANPL|nr:hypothetical protein HPP92_015073 [Vanilla planifolia]